MTNSQASRTTDLIMDLGGVFVHYNPHADAPIEPRTFKRILDSDEWKAYECGRLSQQQCYSAITQSWNLAPNALSQTVQMCISTFSYNDKLVARIRGLKKLGGDIRVHAMSNISLDEFAVLEEDLKAWDIFDSITTSASAGMRKPDPRFYELVLQKLGIEAKAALFVDDRPENVAAAEALGIRSLQYPPEQEDDLEEQLLG